MSKKHFTNGYDESEADDLAILGSRFAHIASDMDSPKLHRARHDNDAGDDRSPKRKSFRPREKMQRDRTS